MLPLAMTMQIGTSPGQTFGVSLFNEPISQSLGLSPSLLGGAYMIASLLAAVPLMAIGRRMDRNGLRAVSLFLVAMVGLGCLVVASAKGVVALTIGFFMLRVFGQGGLSLAASNTLGMWFVRRLGLASGIAGVGMSVAIAVVPSVYHYLIESFGWRMAFTTIGLLTWLLLVPLVILYRNVDLAVDDASCASHHRMVPASVGMVAAMRTPVYWVGTICTALAGMLSTAIFFHLVPLLGATGLTSGQAAAVYPTVAVAMALMQINGGLLADAIPLRVLLCLAMAALAGGVFAFMQIHGVLGAHVAAALMGAGQGLISVTGNTLWPRYFGRHSLGTIRSSVWTATVAGCAAGPFLVGVLLDTTGSYEPSLWILVALSGTAALAALMLTSRPPGIATAIG
jgi:MFS family permease